MLGPWYMVCSAIERGLAPVEGVTMADEVSNLSALKRVVAFEASSAYLNCLSLVRIHLEGLRRRWVERLKWKT